MQAGRKKAMITNTHRPSESCSLSGRLLCSHVARTINDNTECVCVCLLFVGSRPPHCRDRWQWWIALKLHSAVCVFVRVMCSAEKVYYREKTGKLAWLDGPVCAPSPSYVCIGETRATLEGMVSQRFCLATSQLPQMVTGGGGGGGVWRWGECDEEGRGRRRTEV